MRRGTGRVLPADGGAGPRGRAPAPSREEARGLGTVLPAQTVWSRVVMKNTWKLGNCRVSVATKTDATEEQLRPEVARRVRPGVLAGIVLMSPERRDTQVLVCLSRPPSGHVD